MKRIFKIGCTVAILLLVATALPAGAQDLDDVLSGFDDTPAEKKNPAGNKMEDVLSGFDEPAAKQPDEERAEKHLFPKWLEVGGSVGLSAAANFAHDAPEKGAADFRGLSMLRTTAALYGEAGFNGWQLRVSGHGFYDAAYSLQGRGEYSDDLLDLYEDEIEFDDVYLRGRLGSKVDIKTGRQVVVWGKSDNIRVTDILNPLDNRMPGLTDIKDLRLPVTMTRLDYYFGDWDLSGIMIHEVRFDKNPVFNSDFFPGNRPLPPEQGLSDFAMDNQQYALALNGIFSGWDLSFYGARVFDARARIVQGAAGRMSRVHSRITMAGLTSNIAIGNWLFKGEAAGFDGLKFTNLPGEELTRLDVMAGIEYTGFSETRLSLEAVNRHLFNFDDRLADFPDMAEEDFLQTVATLIRDFANDTVQLKVLLMMLGGHGEDGSMERFQLDYDLTDSVAVTFGVIFYQSADRGMLSAIGDNDRIFLRIIYEF
ncbi:MAG: hypothetical protein DSY89_02115 [Deltaproteobacteria bacterium]|nr:MAG: hypothetical protein DSY89_02115 [Deltaproteobacteria bacterium]